jgi:histidinol-phosphatase
VAAPPTPDRDADLGLALELASSAAELALGYFGRPTSSELKADGTPVGEADLAVDRLLTAQLQALRPADGLLSEESGASGGQGRRWIVDPIDGTKAFLAGAEHWGTHVALEEDGRIVVAVVTRPVPGTLWWAAAGGGAHRGRLSEPGVSLPVELSAVARLSDARVTGWRLDAVPLDRVLKQARWVDCAYNELDLVLDGAAEVMMVPGMVWDHAPFALMLAEAGGSLFDPAGGHRLDLGSGVYTNGAVDDELAAVLWGR